MTFDRFSSADPPTSESPDGPTRSAVIERLENLWPDANSGPNSRLRLFVPDRIGRYRIECVLGFGSFAIVCLAHDERLNRKVAIKIPRPEVMANAEHLVRFQSEAEVAAGLDHPGIVPLFEAELEGPIPYLVSAYCAGPDLAKWRERNPGNVPWPDAVQLIAELADAVHYAHEQGVVHRDLKPSNVMLVAGGAGDAFAASLRQYQPRLTDFGLAKLAQSSLEHTRSSLLIGTPLYMAPEQLAGNAGTSAAAIDIYSLGCMLFELIAGRTPIQGETYVEVTDNLRNTSPPKLRELHPDVPRDVETVCGKCLEKDPADRYQTVAELSADLQRCRAFKPIIARPVGRMERVERWCRNPARIEHAGHYAVLYNLWVIAWIAGAFVPLILTQLASPDQMSGFFRDSLVAVLFFQAPKLFIAWQLIQGRRWALWWGAVAAAIQLAVVLASGLGVAAFYDAFYRGNPALRWVAHVNLVLLGAIELSLYILALYANVSATTRGVVRASPGGGSKSA